ncbi:hypothetical protein ACET3Z_004694 [Daucus carota]
MEKKLYDACLEGDVEMLKELMRKDGLILAQLSISSCFNQTPLHLASMLGHFEFAKALLSYKPDFASRLDSQDRSPLHVASANGYANIVKLLLEYDQEMCRVHDEDGRTPLHLAVMNGQFESVIELMKINSFDDEETVFHLCVTYNRLNLLIRLLELNFHDLSNMKDGNGDTVLHTAAALKRMQMIKYLVKSRHKVDVNARNKNDKYKIYIRVEAMEKKLYNACVKGNVEELEALMREDEPTLVRVSVSSCFKQTPLHLASMLGHFEFSKSLHFYKPNFASRLESLDRPPLHLASANG